MIAVKSGPSLISLVTSNQIENFPFFLVLLTLSSWCRHLGCLDGGFSAKLYFRV